jgi:hypothetical protein
VSHVAFHLDWRVLTTAHETDGTPVASNPGRPRMRTLILVVILVIVVLVLVKLARRVFPRM